MKHVDEVLKKIVAPCCVIGETVGREKQWIASIMDFATEVCN
jgi:hypothetical protein